MRFLAALPKHHRLAKRKVIDIRDFDGEDFISIVPNSAIGWERIDKAFEAKGVSPRRRIATPYSQTAYSMVAAGSGSQSSNLLPQSTGQKWRCHKAALCGLMLYLLPIFSGAVTANPIVEEFVLCLRKYLSTNKPMFN